MGTRRNGLTLKEEEVVKWTALGKTESEIATIIGISVSCVRQRKNCAKERLQLYTTAAMTHWALANGVVRNMYLSEKEMLLPFMAQMLVFLLDHGYEIPKDWRAQMNEVPALAATP